MNDTATDQHVYAEVSGTWADRDERGALSHCQRREIDQLSGSELLKLPYLFRTGLCFSALIKILFTIGGSF